MPATATDRLFGLTTSVAVKPACVAVSTTNLTLSGLQTVGGVVLVSGDRVLVKDQTDTTQNGIWVASSGAWIRATDFDGARDVVKGTLVVASGDTNIYYRVTTADPVTIGSSAITFETVGASFTSTSIGQTLDSLKRTAAEIAAGVTPVNYAYPPGDVRRYGGVFDGVTDDGPAWQRACNVASLADANGPGGEIFSPPLPTMISTAVLITVPGNRVMSIFAYGTRVLTSGGITPFSVTYPASNGGLDVYGIRIDHSGNSTALYGFDCYYTWNVRFIGCTFIGGTHTGYAGVKFRNGTASDSGTGCLFCKCIDCTFYSTANDMPNGVIIQGASNATSILGCSFNGVVTCVYMTPESGQDYIANAALIQGCAFETYSTAIYSNSDGEVQNGLRILANRFENGANVFIYAPTLGTQPAVPPVLSGNFLVSDAGTYIDNVNDRYYTSYDVSVTPALSTSLTVQSATPMRIKPTGSADRALEVYASTAGADTGIELKNASGTVIGLWTNRTGSIGQMSTGEVVLTSATPTTAANQMGLGTTRQDTVGAAGSASALPGAPQGYWVVDVAGSKIAIPYWLAS